MNKYKKYRKANSVNAIVCGSSQGKCWMQGDLCMKGEYTGYRCIRTDNTIFYCTSPCM